MGIKYIFSMSEQRKELIETALEEYSETGLDTDPSIDDTINLFEDAEPCDVDGDVVNDLEA